MTIKQINITSEALEKLAILLNGESKEITDIVAALSDECFEVSYIYKAGIDGWNTQRTIKRTIKIRLSVPDSTTKDYKERCLLLEKSCDELEEENHTLEEENHTLEMEVHQLLQELREK
jgi:cell division protein FtsB